MRKWTAAEEGQVAGVGGGGGWDAVVKKAQARGGVNVGGSGSGLVPLPKSFMVHARESARASERESQSEPE
jgi:hypothetical protein